MSRLQTSGGMALAMALALAACGKPAASVPVPVMPLPAPTETVAPALDEAPAATAPRGSEARPEVLPPAPVVGADGGTPRSDDVAVGWSRDTFLARLGPCAQRVLLMTAGATPTEVYQPRGGDCVKRFGEQQFYVVGDRVARIQSGLSHYVPPHSQEGPGAH